MRHQPDYYVWGLMTTSYVVWPELFEVETLETAVIAHGRSEGRIEAAPDGRPVDVVTGVDTAGLRARVLKRWARD